MPIGAWYLQSNATYHSVVYRRTRRSTLRRSCFGSCRTRTGGTATVTSFGGFQCPPLSCMSSHTRRAVCSRSFHIDRVLTGAGNPMASPPHVCRQFLTVNVDGREQKYANLDIVWAILGTISRGSLSTISLLRRRVISPT